MFGRRFAYELSSPGEPLSAWLRDLPVDRTRIGQLVRLSMWRELFGRGGPLGMEGPSGDEEAGDFAGWARHCFGRGDLKYALLALLQEQPMHGYEMMKALEERTRGMYAPSPGSVYPTLQMLEDRGFVTASEADGKKVYTITEAGRAFLAEDQPEERGRRRGRRRLSEAELAEIAAIRHEVREIQGLLGNAIRSAVIDPSMIAALRRELARMRADLSELAGQPGTPER